MLVCRGFGCGLAAVWPSFSLRRSWLRFGHCSFCGFSCGLGIVVVAVLPAVWASFLLRFDCGLGIVSVVVLAAV